MSAYVKSRQRILLSNKSRLGIKNTALLHILRGKTTELRNAADFRQNSGGAPSLAEEVEWFLYLKYYSNQAIS